MTEFHGDADGDHCFKCGRDLRQGGSSVHGVIGMTYRMTDEPVVACDEHKDDLTRLYLKERKEAT